MGEVVRRVSSLLLFVAGIGMVAVGTMTMQQGLAFVGVMLVGVVLLLRTDASVRGVTKAVAADPEPEQPAVLERTVPADSNGWRVMEWCKCGSQEPSAPVEVTDPMGEAPSVTIGWLCPDCRGDRHGEGPEPPTETVIEYVAADGGPATGRPTDVLSLKRRIQWHGTAEFLKAQAALRERFPTMTRSDLVACRTNLRHALAAHVEDINRLSGAWAAVDGAYVMPQAEHDQYVGMVNVAEGIKAAIVEVDARLKFMEGVDARLAVLPPDCDCEYEEVHSHESDFPTRRFMKPCARHAATPVETPNTRTLFITSAGRTRDFLTGGYGYKATERWCGKSHPWVGPEVGARWWLCAKCGSRREALDVPYERAPTLTADAMADAHVRGDIEEFARVAGTLEEPRPTRSPTP